jgi:alpha-D-xyloside xylohydrolase
MWDRRDDGLVLHCGGLVVRACWQGRGIVRVAAVAAETGEPKLADGPMLDPARVVEPVPFEVRELASELVMSDGTLEVHIDLASGAFTYRDATGGVLFGEDERLLWPRDDGGFRARLGLRFSPGEALYGLGQHEEGRLDYRGRGQDLYQHNLKVPLPMLVSSRGWGLLWHGYSAMRFRDDEAGSYLEAECADELDYFVIAGDRLDDVVRRYRWLTGAASMPPRWAFGFIQSKERYETQDELLDVARRYAELGLPLDGIVQDWQYWPEGQWGQKSFDPQRFPDPKAMCDQVHELGTKIVISVWPHLSNDGADRLQFQAAGKLLANDTTYDAFDPQARAMFWTQADQAMFSKGFDGWWADCSEPFEPDWTWSAAPKPSPEERWRLHIEMAEKYLGARWSNAYALLHNSGIWEGQRGTGSSKRVLTLTRSAWAGQQRYGTFVWSGDINASWETLRRQIPEALNFCAAGLPYWNSDIGGFFTASRENWFWRGEFERGVDDPEYRELFLRWFQFATFLPMMRAHGTDTPREIWHFGEPGSAIYDALVRSIELRKALMPYLYSVAGAVHLDGYTMMRPLAFDFAHDPVALRVEDEFMLGPALLICPVTTPQAQTRRVYLPSGTSWIDVWSGAVHDGGTWIDAPSPLQTIPVYARAGSILPLADAGADLRLVVFPGADGSYILYEDEGDGWAYETGAYTRTNLKWIDADSTLVIGATDGAYPAMPTVRRVRATRISPDSGWHTDTVERRAIEYHNRHTNIELRQSPEQ